VSGALRGTWRRLGIEPTTDQGAIRRAYADALRAMDVDADVAGFTALRDARDTALAWARQQPRDEAPPPLADEQAPPKAPEDTSPQDAAFEPGTWPHAAPRLDGWAGAADLVAGEDHGHDALVPPLPISPAQGPADSQFGVDRPTLLAPEWTFDEAPSVRLSPAKDPREDGPRADHALHALLLEGPGTEFGLTDNEREAALGHLAALVARADGGGVDLWSRTEEWLAETLARSWPRSAPLLDSAARTFGWADRPATTGDSPAVAFLIPRLGTRPLTRSPRSAEDALYVLLLPEDGALPPLTDAQEEEARQLLDTVLAEARMAQVERSEEIEAWLADLLVQAWPRSAPLLEACAQTFNWESERGRLGERPPIAFLNARLRGLRFAQKVQDKGHPMRKAWKELTREGSRKGLFAPARQVRQLIAGVRDNFPELEQHFNPALVSAWEGRRGGGGIRMNFGWGAILLIGLIRMVIAIGEYGHDHPSPGAPPIAPYEAGAPGGSGPVPDFDPATDPVLADVVHQLFGPDMTYADLRKANPNLAGTINANRRMTANAGDLAHQGQVVLTERLLYARARAAPARLEALARWRLDMLQAAKADGPDTCVSVYRWGDLPKGAEMTGPALDRQQQLARTLLAAGELDAPPPGNGDRSYMIPGPMIEQVITATGLSKEAVLGVFNAKGSAATVCSVRIALLKAALGWKGSDRQPILRLL